MNKRQVLDKILKGELSPEKAAVLARGRMFWAMEEGPDLFNVEVSEPGHRIDKIMSLSEIEELKPECAGWIVTSMEHGEFIHDGNRDDYPYKT